MLVLTRKIGERIQIGEGLDRIEVTLIRVGRDRARIGVSAPGTLRILRPNNGAKHDTGTVDEQPRDIV